MADFEDPELAALRQKLRPEVWQRRVEKAERAAALVEAVEEARSGGATEEEALARLAPELPRSTFHGRRRRFLQGGMLRLIDRHAGKMAKATPEIRQVICAARRVDPQVDVERIAAIILEQFDVTVSTTVIKRVLCKAGLNRPPGGGVPGQRKAEERLFAGGIFLQIADQETGCSQQLAEAIAALRAELPEPEVAVSPQRDHRDGQGHFTAAYNQALLARGESDLGPAFRSISEKRREVDLRQRRAAQEDLGTLQRKVQALISLPLLTDTGKAIELNDYQGGWGIAEFAGTMYRADTLNRFLRDLNYLSAGAPLTSWFGGFWLQHEQAIHPEAEFPAAVCIYVDGVGKALWTQHFTKAGRVSGNGRVMPCLDQVLVHTGMGTPIYWQSFSGHASLVTQTLPLLNRLEAVVGPKWFAERLVVLDGEGAAVGLFREFDQANRLFVTILPADRIQTLAEVESLGAWFPFRTHEEAAEGFVTLRDSKDGQTYRTRAVIIRRRSGRKFLVLVTNAPAAGADDEGSCPGESDLPADSARCFETLDLAQAYFSRWPAQELRFREWNQATRFKRISGYGKLRVQNVAVLTELDKKRAYRGQLERRIGKLRADRDAAQAALMQAKLRLNAAKARRVRQDDLVAEEIEQSRPDREVLQERFAATQRERERHSAALAMIAERQTDLAAIQAKVDQAETRLPQVVEQIADLEARKEIFVADTELDQIATVFKLCFVLLAEFALSRYFAGLRLSLHGFMRQILSLPGTRTLEGQTEHIRIKASPNREIMAAVETACQRVNALQLTRKNRLLKLSVDWSGNALQKGAKAATRP